MESECEIVIKNYRCFSDVNPAKICLRPGRTAIVGPNNAGKSAVLRFFYEFRTLFVVLVQSLSAPGSFPDRQALSWGKPRGVFDQNEIFTTTNERSLEIQLHFVAPPLKLTTRVKPLVGVLSITVNRDNSAHAVASLNLDKYHVTTNAGSIAFLDIQNRNVRISDGLTTVIYKISPLYEILDKLSKSVYWGAFRNILTLGSDQKYFDLSIGKAFVSLWDNLRSGTNSGYQRSQTKLVTNAIRRIFDLDSLDITPSQDGTTLIIDTADRTHRLDEFGSGLSHFILLLTHAILDKPSFIMIDEPELHLHPKLQLDLLELLEQFTSDGIIFATHSIGLAQSAAEHVYVVQQDKNGISSLSPYSGTQRLAEMLGEMNYSRYRELGCEGILLVEGVYDVPIFKHILRTYGKAAKFAVLPLGGKSMITRERAEQLDEVLRMTTIVHAIVDSERKTKDAQLETPIQEFESTCQKLGVRCHILEKRAIENYFTDEALKKKNKSYKKLDDFQDDRDIGQGWQKAHGGQVAESMSKEDWASTDIGKFIDQL